MPIPSFFESNCRYQIVGVFLLIQLCIIGADRLRRSNLSSITNTMNQTSLRNHQRFTGFFAHCPVRWILFG